MGLLGSLSNRQDMECARHDVMRRTVLRGAEEERVREWDEGIGRIQSGTHGWKSGGQESEQCLFTEHSLKALYRTPRHGAPMSKL